MEPSTQADCWPKRSLRQHPLRQVLVCGRSHKPPLYSHVVSYLRIEVPLHGVYRNCIELNREVRELNLRPGMALLAPPNCWNLPEWRPGLELLCLGFSRARINISLVSARSRERQQIATCKSSLRQPVDGPLPHIVSALEDLPSGASGESIAADLVRALLHAVEHLMHQPLTPPVSQAQRLLDDIRLFLQSHYHYEITRDSVARQFDVSPNHLSRLFRTHGQMTFSGYLTQVRMDRAKHLLRNYDLKLQDISVRCGYHDTPYFCHVFKHATKVTPKEYRLRSHRAHRS